MSDNLKYGIKDFVSPSLIFSTKQTITAMVSLLYYYERKKAFSN